MILEEGLLSGIVAEVLVGVQSAGAMSLVESAAPAKHIQQHAPDERDHQRAAAEADRERRRQIMEKQHRMSQVVGKESYNGVNLFEGTEPLARGGAPDSSPGASTSGALSGVAPTDPGVDISTFFGRR